MGPTGVVFVLVYGALSTPEVGGPVARALAPGAVVREVAGAAGRWASPPPWAAAGVVGLPVAEVQRALGPARAVERGEGGGETWTYLAAEGGGSTRYIVFDIRGGRVTRALPMRVTSTPAKWPHKLPGLLFEF